MSSDTKHGAMWYCLCGHCCKVCSCMVVVAMLCSLISKLCSLLQDWSQCCMVSLVTVAGFSDDDVG